LLIFDFLRASLEDGNTCGLDYEAQVAFTMGLTAATPFISSLKIFRFDMASFLKRYR
jgi:hypothetical protein